MDFINPATGEASGDVARRLIKAGGDVGVLRPWLGEDGRSYITVNRGGKPVTMVSNAPATLRRDQWIAMDDTVLRIARQRLGAWSDLMSRPGLRKDVPNGLAKPVIQYQNQGDLGPATMSMDGLRQSDRDRSVFDYVNLPLPIIHKDVNYSMREVLVSHAAGMGAGADGGLDTTWLEVAARKCAEEVEKLLLGTSSSFTYGGGTIYGYTNYPSRATKVMTAPTGANPYSTLADVLAMRAQLQALNHYGPYMIYTSLSWDTYLDNDYVVSATGTATTGTLRNRILQLPNILGVKTLDYLPAKTMLMIEMVPEVVRGIVGLDFTTVEWESFGGMQLNYKVMTIQVPQMRKDQLNQTGIVHGTHP